MKAGVRSESGEPLFPSKNWRFNNPSQNKLDDSGDSETYQQYNGIYYYYLTEENELNNEDISLSRPAARFSFKKSGWDHYGYNKIVCWWTVV